MKQNTGIIKILLGSLLLVWILAHIPGIIYGTTKIPLHISYVGDEQAPVNGALHMLQEKSLLGITGRTTAYYGPIFSIVAIPSILIDAGLKYMTGVTHSALEYKNSIIFDWGGILKFARITSVISSLVFLFSIYFFLKPKNKREISFVAFFSVTLIALNYYFFEYSHFFKHWIYIVTALGVQWWSLRMIYEDAHKKKWWFLHWLATVFSIGISYFSVISLVMWIPVILRWIRVRDFHKLRMFARLTYTTVISTLVLVLWHPTTVLRYIGIAGVPGVSNQGGQGVQNLFDFSNTSIGYYSNVLFLNQLPLLIVIAIFCCIFWKEKIYRKVEIWIIFLPGLANFLFFMPPAHHEGRYMLPSIVSLIVLCGFFLVEYREKIQSKFTVISIYALILLYLVFHSVNILGWIQVYSKGPLEQTMIQNVLEKSQQGKSKILLVQGYIAGHVHTKEAYQLYMKNFNKGGFNLYKELLSTPLPQGVVPLNATYVAQKNYLKNVKIGDTYDQVVYMHVPRKELGELNQFDYIDENIVRIWRYDDLMPTYEYIK